MHWLKSSMRVLLHDVKGFSLVELMVAVAIMSILVTVGGVSFLVLRPSKNMLADARDLLSDIQVIRLEAVKRNTCVGLVLQPVGTPPGGSYFTFVDDGSGGGTPCDAIHDPGEITLQTVSVRGHVTLQMSPVAATVADPNVNGLPLSLVSTDLFTSISFNQRSMVVARVNNGNGSCIFANDGRFTAPVWARVVVRITGTANLQRSSDPNVENGWSR